MFLFILIKFDMLNVHSDNAMSFVNYSCMVCSEELTQALFQATDWKILTMCSVHHKI